MSKRKILYVDDEEINLMIFKINLKDQYEILTADSGMQALQILDSDPEIKVVISDMRMPAMDGLEFITKAKEHRPELKYYMLTGFGLTPEIENALNTGLIIKNFSKPCDQREIDAEIQRVFR